eukprot:scaffold3795_cov334-Prasinococcus_capsulatus_cf.AAC.3
MGRTIPSCRLGCGRHLRGDDGEHVPWSVLLGRGALLQVVPSAARGAAALRGRTAAVTEARPGALCAAPGPTG